jgi:homopolymeric O-antigen transport system permease protein
MRFFDMREDKLVYGKLLSASPNNFRMSIEYMQVSDKTVIYDSSRRGSPALEELHGIFQYRDLIYQLVRRDIVTRYKRSALGIAWTMLQPLGMMIIMTIVFSNLFQTVKGYPSYILSGLIAWTFFSQTTTAAIHQVVWGGTLFRRIYLPHTSFAVSAIFTGLVNLTLSLVPLIAIMLVTGKPLHWTLAFIPVAMLLFAAFALGVGLILSTMAVYFPDIVEMYQIVLVAWMYLTPIFYPEEILPKAYRFWITNLNPMYHLVRIFRLPIYEGIWPAWNETALAALIAIITLILGWLFFSKQADDFAYRA